MKTDSRLFLHTRGKFFLVHSTMDSTAHSSHFNSLEHCICTTMTSVHVYDVGPAFSLHWFNGASLMQGVVVCSLQRYSVETTKSADVRIDGSGMGYAESSGGGGTALGDTPGAACGQAVKQEIIADCACAIHTLIIGFRSGSAIFHLLDCVMLSFHVLYL